MKMFKLFTFTGSEKVLDLGCGDGEITDHLCKHRTKNHVHGMDISEKLIEKASQVYSDARLTFSVGDMSAFSTKEKYDVVHLGSFLDNVDAEKTLTCVLECLDPGGTALITLSGKFHSSPAAQSERLSQSAKWKDDFREYKHISRYYNSREFSEVLHKVGFIPKHVEEVLQKVEFLDQNAIETYLSDSPHARYLPAFRRTEFISDLISLMQSENHVFDLGKPFIYQNKLEVIAMKTLSEPSYALSTGKPDEERLTILNELHNEPSLSALKITPGMHVLTVGCGIALLELQIANQVTSTGFVLATDISQQQLQIAEENASRSGLENVKFLQVSALDISQVPGTFDRIHCRFVLTHLPWEKISQILPLLHAKLAPGGFLLLEECSTIDSLACEPSNPGYDKWKMVVHKQFIMQKSDSSPGKRILQHLEEQGWHPTHTFYQPVLSTQREKSILALGVRSIRNKLFQEKLFSVEEIDEMLQELSELEQNPAVSPHYSEVIQIKISR
jgi:2-polyprenyl-3-methyl-5-hydroxy-6-metoxy-1,4-benzoquinol methylase